MTEGAARLTRHDRLATGDRVRILHCPPGWLPHWLEGTMATVIRTNGAGVTIEPDETRSGWLTRYLPHDVTGCVEVVG